MFRCLGLLHGKMFKYGNFCVYFWVKKKKNFLQKLFVLSEVHSNASPSSFFFGKEEITKTTFQLCASHIVIFAFLSLFRRFCFLMFFFLFFPFILSHLTHAAVAPAQDQCVLNVVLFCFFVVVVAAVTAASTFISLFFLFFLFVFFFCSNIILSSFALCVILFFLFVSIRILRRVSAVRVHLY